MLVQLVISLYPLGGPSRRPEEPTSRPVQAIHPQALQASIAQVEPMQQPYQFQVYVPPMQGTPRQVPTWQVTVAPAQTHMNPSSSSSTTHPHMMRSGPQTHTSHQFRDDTWEAYNPPEDIPPQTAPYDYRYRDDQPAWSSGAYYEPPVSKLIRIYRKVSYLTLF